MLDDFKDQKELQVIVFNICNQDYVVPIKYVQEIITPKIITHLPKLPSIKGVINLRGRIVPILCGKSKFGLSLSYKYKRDRRIMIFYVNHKIIGLIVDDVLEVIHLKTEKIEPSPAEGMENFSFIQGIVKYLNKPVILVNPKRLLNFSESIDIKKLMKIRDDIEIKQNQNSLMVTTI